ncbi:MAG TPA: hypothetical protein VJ842_14305 [Pyrinomonadaceae bacterium]|nr:hypothetical protein [Pyrinomonadaceae bacterium]
MTTLYGVTIPAGALVNGVVESFLDATYLQNGGGGSGFTMQVRLGGVVLFEDPTANYGSSATPHSIGWRSRLYLENKVMTAPRITGEHWIAGQPAVVGDGDLGNLATVLQWSWGGASAINMAIAQLLEFRIQHTAALPSISITRQVGQSDLIRLNG